jgi:hypothetical protein
MTDQTMETDQGSEDFESPAPVEQPDSPELEAANAKAEEGGAHPVANGTVFYTDVEPSAVGAATEEPRPDPTRRVAEPEADEE